MAREREVLTPTTPLLCDHLTHTSIVVTTNCAHTTHPKRLTMASMC